MADFIVVGCNVVVDVVVRLTLKPLLLVSLTYCLFLFSVLPLCCLNLLFSFFASAPSSPSCRCPDRLMFFVAASTTTTAVVSASASASASASDNVSDSSVGFSLAHGEY